MRFSALLLSIVLGFDSSAWAQQVPEPYQASPAKGSEPRKAAGGTGENAKVKLCLWDKTVVKGYISRIDTDSFEVTDKKHGQVRTIGPKCSYAGTSPPWGP